MFTQGFHQSFKPIVIAVPLSFVINVTDASCYNFSDGSITIDSLSGCGTIYTISIDGVETSTSIDSLFAGTYDINISTDENCSFDTSITIYNSGENCELSFFNAISPNGDGTNDRWTITRVETVPDNSVQIYSRWGTLVWEATGYDNDQVVWEGQSNAGGDLPDGTYYYVVTANGDNYTGFVEITR